MLHQSFQAIDHILVSLLEVGLSLRHLIVVDSRVYSALGLPLIHLLSELAHGVLADLRWGCSSVSIASAVLSL